MGINSNKLRKKILVSSIVSGAIFVGIFLIFEELALFNSVVNLLIVFGISLVSLIVNVIFSRINLIKQLPHKPDDEVFLIEYDVYPTELQAFNQYFLDIEKSKRLFILISVIGLIVISCGVCIMAGVNMVLVLEVMILTILMLIFTFYKIRNKSGIPEENKIHVSISENGVLLNGIRYSWNSEKSKITGVFLRKINENVSCLSVYYNKYLKIDIDLEGETDFQRKSGGKPEKKLKMEKQIRIPVPANKTDNIQSVLDRLLKLKNSSVIK